MNQNNEQIDPGLNIVLSIDQPLKPKQIQTSFVDILGDGCYVDNIWNRNVVVYSTGNGPKKVLLCHSITYLGNPHPIFKKRIQIPLWWKDFYNSYHDIYDVRYMGIYHYNGLRVFVDFDTKRYVKNKSHNSSAHVYINDLYQGITGGVFMKEDRNRNVITVVSVHNLKSYLDGSVKIKNPIFDIFNLFNSQFSFNKWLLANEVFSEMRDNNWSQWRQAEWPGWYLEYLVSRYIRENNLNDIVIYTGLSNKKHGDDLDFDLYFPQSVFYGDLKSSDISKTEVPGNDQSTVMSCVNRFGRLWYVVYEHETKYDRDFPTHPMTVWWNESLGKDDDVYSYVTRMKHSVNYRKMMIIEVNRINCHTILSQFNQGHQPDGKDRNPKFLIRKRDIDNYVIFRYSPTENE